jgi:hypothetical protein
MRLGRYLELDENKNTTRKGLWDASEAILRENHGLKCTHEDTRETTN